MSLKDYIPEGREEWKDFFIWMGLFMAKAVIEIFVLWICLG